VNRAIAGTHAYARGAGLLGADNWGVLSLFLIAASCAVLGYAVYLLIKSGRRPYLKRGKKPHSHRRD